MERDIILQIIVILLGNNPPPNSYTLLSSFSKNIKKGKIFTFGITRDAYAKVK